MTLDPGVTVPQGRQPEGAVEPGVLVVADADEGQLEEPDNRRQDLLARKAAQCEVGIGALADARQRLPESKQAIELGLLALLAPARVIAVLFPPLRVAPRRLQMGRGIG